MGGRRSKTRFAAALARRYLGRHMRTCGIKRTNERGENILHSAVVGVFDCFSVVDENPAGFWHFSFLFQICGKICLIKIAVIHLEHTEMPMKINAIRRVKSAAIDVGKIGMDCGGFSKSFCTRLLQFFNRNTFSKF